jgi:hypothetical protein
VLECPSFEEEYGRFRCFGRVTIREATGAHRRLADGRSPRGRWADRGFDVALTRLGHRLASGPSGVLATVTFSVDRTGYRPTVLRWTIRLKVPRSRRAPAARTADALEAPTHMRARETPR